MPEEAPAVPVTQPESEGAPGGKPQEGQSQEEPKTFSAEYVAELRAEAAKHRTAAKTASTELEKERRGKLSDDEKVIAEAEERGRTGAATEFGRELARERFDALAGRRNPDVNTDDVLEYVDLGKFLDDTGRPDNKAIESAVKRLVPEPAGTPSFEGGTRQSAPAGKTMSDLIRNAAGRT